MLLCEAALGKSNHLTSNNHTIFCFLQHTTKIALVYHTAHGKFIDKAMLDDAGFDSVQGMVNLMLSSVVFRFSSFLIIKYDDQRVLANLKLLIKRILAMLQCRLVCFPYRFA
jgi:hypothetical protein